jgi:cell filamentation protein
MKNHYEYIDPDYIYTDPKTNLLRNKENIDDKDILLSFESLKVSEKLERLQDNPIKIKNSNSLLEIHNFLFCDIYEWAGKKRTVEISKDGKGFLQTKRFDAGFTHIDSLIEEYRKIPAGDIRKLSHKLAEVLDALNYLHPFREGNGRAQREFIRTFALEKDIELNLNPPDNKDIYERYMAATINGDVEKLTDLIFEIVRSKSKKAIR